VNDNFRILGIDSVYKSFFTCEVSAGYLYSISLDYAQGLSLVLLAEVFRQRCVEIFCVDV
jgi:hypothetical protein